MTNTRSCIFVGFLITCISCDLTNIGKTECARITGGNNPVADTLRLSMDAYYSVSLHDPPIIIAEFLPTYTAGSDDENIAEAVIHLSGDSLFVFPINPGLATIRVLGEIGAGECYISAGYSFPVNVHD